MLQERLDMNALTDFESKVSPIDAIGPGGARTVMSTPLGLKIGSMSVSMTAMAGNRASVFLNFAAGLHAGLHLSLHASADEMRNLACEILRYAEAAERAQGTSETKAGVVA